MKPLYLLLFTICSFQTLNAQIWIRKGATWHYEWYELSTEGFDRIHYEKDTLVFGKNCQKLTGVQYRFNANSKQNVYLSGIYNLPDQYTYASGDTVFYLNNSKFYVLYNFNTVVNDTWRVAPPKNLFKCTGSAVKVDSTGTTLINNKNLRTMHLNPLSNSNMSLSGQVNERFGAMEKYLFPILNVCDASPLDGYDYYFKCYQDDSFLLYNPTKSECEFMLTSSINSPEKAFYKILIYPNPTNGLLNIFNSNSGSIQLEIYALTGQLEKQYSLEENDKTIDVSFLKTGFYLFKITDTDGVSQYQKIVVN